MLNRIFEVSNKKYRLISITFILLLVGASYLLYLNDNHFYKHQENLIKNIMAYPMQEVVERCKKDNDYCDDDMIILEQELKRYLILAILNKKLLLPMYSQDVDNLWHSFILFTKKYHSFCNKYSSQFIHHAPETQQTGITPEISKKNSLKFKKFIKVYEQLFKEEPHSIWFLDSCKDT